MPERPSRFPTAPTPPARAAAPHVQAVTGRGAQAKSAPPPAPAVRAVAAPGPALVLQGCFPGGLSRVVQACRLGGTAQPHAAFPLPPGFLPPAVPGQRLPDGVRREMETLFGTDFSGVRVHTSPAAAAIGASAFTLGSDLHFAPGELNPDTARGRRLLAHELTHVVQQRTGQVRNPFGNGVAVVHNHALEAEADRMGLRAVASRQPPQAAPRTPHPATIQRQVLGQWGFQRVWNLAEQHGQGITTLGYTPPWLNDLIIENTTVAGDVAAAIKPPQIQVTQKSQGVFEAVVTNVPTNHAGYRMKLPMAPPWRSTGPRGRMLAMIGEKDPDKYKSPNTEIGVQVFGDPDDETLERQIEKHEKVHAEDILRKIDQILKPWDARLTRAMQERTVFQGATAQEAEKAVYDAVGGTREKIGQLLYDAWDDDSKTFHKHAKGKTIPVMSKTGSNDSATRVWFTYRLSI